MKTILGYEWKGTNLRISIEEYNELPEKEKQEYLPIISQYMKRKQYARTEGRN